MGKSLGQIGYEAYGEEADWKAYNGERMPEWDDLPSHIHRKWEVAAESIESEIRLRIESFVNESMGNEPLR